ncbi:MAG TPA: diacylglycerol kinase family protein [Intrasporangium sp.]|uniref:diacylglycerol/lipid kinase family protein n=1 Tax=Intrasporangium sp. TaxID=1925024 RepID=UPI002D78FF6A|nr:diacylglycerol kinase family protein [Intrasporangium sp.]HET7398343.1 diacylglycerol kinase family protein [Intrasporangium sp.]
MAHIPGSSRRRLAVVVNPLRLDDVDATRRVIEESCRRHGWDEPSWVETTAEEPGEKQGREAVEAGADVVCSLGGDGTVRAVASALVGTDVALGLLPGGTGNLLARNLGLPVDSIEEAMEAVLAGSDRTIDVGLMRAGPAAGPQPKEDEVGEDEYVFLVMAGAGLDGEIMADTNEKVKEVAGWLAYLLAGAQKLAGRGFTVTVESTAPAPTAADDRDEVATLRRHARMVVVGNCGTLQGGVELLPDAVVDDGILDGVVLAPKGIGGWLSVIVDVVTRHRHGHRRLDRLRATRLRIRMGRPVIAEVDGDPIGEHESLSIRVLPQALVVRVA